MATKKTKPTDTSAEVTASLDDVDPVTRYARRVVDGELIAGPDIRAACARHLRDMLVGHTRGLVFDREEAERKIAYFPDVLRLNGGEYEGVKFTLLNWQQFIVGSLYGWKNADDGSRRFRMAYVETGKGSGKSPLAAGIGLIGLTADNEARAEVYAAATKKDQAMILFRDAVAMVDQSPALAKRLRKSGVGLNTWSLAYMKTGSWFRPISADDGQSGPRPHVGLIDEVHEHKTNTVIEMIRAGTKNRRQALIFMITNSGADKNSPCWDYHEYGQRVCQGAEAGGVDDDSFFAFICSLDPGDDPFKDESCWVKSNPSLQESNLPGMKYLREQVHTARGMPSKEAMVRRLNFCEWTGAINPWLSDDVWRNAALTYDWGSLRGRRAYGGLDLASTTDLTGLVLLVEPIADGEPWKLVPFAWLPDHELGLRSSKDKVPYDVWRAAGLLHVTQGQAVSKVAVARKISELASFFDIQAIAYDRWRIKDFLIMCDEEGITLPPMEEFGQGYKDMSPAVSKFEEMILNGELAHPNHPILNMCITNTVTTEDDAGNKKPSKGKASGRIDLAVSAIMAVGVMAKAEPEDDLDEALRNPVFSR
jgi:phage terminase large subunit-like protein